MKLVRVLEWMILALFCAAVNATLVILTSSPEADRSHVVNVSSSARVSFTCRVEDYSVILQRPLLCIRQLRYNFCKPLTDWNDVAAVGTYTINEVMQDLDNSQASCVVAGADGHNYSSDVLHLIIREVITSTSGSMPSDPHTSSSTTDISPSDSNKSLGSDSSPSATADVSASTVSVLDSKNSIIAGSTACGVIALFLLGCVVILVVVLCCGIHRPCCQDMQTTVVHGGGILSSGSPGEVAVGGSGTELLEYNDRSNAVHDKEVHDGEGHDRQGHSGPVEFLAGEPSEQEGARTTVACNNSFLRARTQPTSMKRDVPSELAGHLEVAITMEEVAEEDLYERAGGSSQGDEFDEIPVSQGPVPVGLVPVGPVPVSPVPVGPVPVGPVPVGPVPAGPVSQGPVPVSPVPANPVLASPVSEGPVPASPMSEGPVPANPVLEGPGLGGLVPTSPMSEGPVPAGPVPASPVLEGPLPDQEERRDNTESCVVSQCEDQNHGRSIMVLGFSNLERQTSATEVEEGMLPQMLEDSSAVYSFNQL